MDSDSNALTSKGGYVKSSDIEGGDKSIHHKSYHDEKHDRQNDSQVAKHGKNDGAIETKRHEAPAYRYWVSERSVGEFHRSDLPFQPGSIARELRRI